MTLGSNLLRLDGFPFEVRYSQGSAVRAKAAADVAARAYDYFSRLFNGFKPDIALIVADQLDWADWTHRCPYGLPFFNDDLSDVRPGVVVMPAGSGDFWHSIAQALREASTDEYALLLAAYPNDGNDVDLQPFFDLITIHELGHVFEVLGGLRLPTFWLGEIFANLALHTFVATQQPASLETLEVLPSVGAGSSVLATRMQTSGYSTLEELEAHYTGGDDAMDALNYVWYQCKWQRLAAAMFESDGEDALVRFWDCFRPSNENGEVTEAALTNLLTTEVSATLGRAIQDWH